MISSNNLVSTTATIPNIVFTNVSTGSINATGITSSALLVTGLISTNNLFSTTATIPNLKTTNISTGTLNATDVNIAGGTIANIVTNNVNYGIANTYSGSFVASNNISTATDITGFSFTNADIRSFSVKVTVSILRSAGGNLYATFTLDGTQTDSSWVLFTSYDGDNTGIDFSITSSGVMQYTSTNITNFTSSTFRYSVTQITNTGTYSTLLNPTVGSYIIDTLSSNNVVTTNMSSGNMISSYDNGNSVSSTTSNFDIRNTNTGSNAGAFMRFFPQNQTSSNFWQIGSEGTTGNYSFRVYNQNGNGVYMNSGNTSWTSQSDRRIKRDINSLNSCLDKIIQLNPVKYNFNTDPIDYSPRTGFIAQEVQEVLPNIVSSNTTEEYSDGLLGLSMTEMIPYLVGALKEANERITMLEEILL